MKGATPVRQDRGSDRGIAVSNKTGVTTMTPNANISDPSGQINGLLYPQKTYSPILKIIKKPQVLELACISKSTLHLQILGGLFPPSILLGDRAVAFVEYEVLAVITAQIQGKSKDEIRILVKDLVAQRQHLSPSMSLGERGVALVEYEALTVISAEIEGKSKDEIKVLVKSLIAQRKNLLSEVQS